MKKCIREYLARLLAMVLLAFFVITYKNKVAVQNLTQNNTLFNPPFWKLYEKGNGSSRRKVWEGKSFSCWMLGIHNSWKLWILRIMLLFFLWMSKKIIWYLNKFFRNQNYKSIFTNILIICHNKWVIWYFYYVKNN